MNDTTLARQTFRDAFNGQTNFMTPEVLRYGKKGDLFYELSAGTGMHGERIYGVTVITTKGERTDLSKGGFDDVLKAEKYITSLRQLAITTVEDAVTEALNARAKELIPHTVRPSFIEQVTEAARDWAEACYTQDEPTGGGS